MDYDLGVWVLSQQAAGARDVRGDEADDSTSAFADDFADVSTDESADVSAETFDGAQWHSQDELDYRPWWKDIVHT
jgi:hypothetical protein